MEWAVMENGSRTLDEQATGPHYWAASEKEGGKTTGLWLKVLFGFNRLPREGLWRVADYIRAVRSAIASHTRLARRAKYHDSEHRVGRKLCHGPHYAS